MSLPKPYYDKDGITIYHADCREILPFVGRVDIVATDPPYGMDFQSNRRFVKHKRIVGDDNLPLDVIRDCIFRAECAAYFFCRWDNIGDMPKPKSVIAWVKNVWGTGDLYHEHGRMWEACCFYPGKRHEFIKRPPDVLFQAKTGNDLHPTQKPVELMGALIGANVGDIVLDPFMGSGTTLVAAKQLGRKCVGIELEEKYCEIAVQRLAQDILPFGEVA